MVRENHLHVRLHAAPSRPGTHGCEESLALLAASGVRERRLDLRTQERPLTWIRTSRRLSADGPPGQPALTHNNLQEQSARFLLTASRRASDGGRPPDGRSLPMNMLAGMYL